MTCPILDVLERVRALSPNLDFVALPAPVISTATLARCLNLVQLAEETEAEMVAAAAADTPKVVQVTAAAILRAAAIPKAVQVMAAAILRAVVEATAAAILRAETAAILRAAQEMEVAEMAAILKAVQGMEAAETVATHPAVAIKTVAAGAVREVDNSNRSGVLSSRIRFRTRLLTTS